MGLNLALFTIASSDIRLLPSTTIELNLKVDALSLVGSKRKIWQKKPIRKIDKNFTTTIAHIEYYDNEYRFPKTMSKVSLVNFKGIENH